MSKNFDSEAFLGWLDAYGSPVPKETLHEQWPNFPWENVPTGITGAITDGGKIAYYSHDLRRAAEGKPNVD
jgi:hypothetical protein